MIQIKEGFKNPSQGKISQGSPPIKGQKFPKKSGISGQLLFDLKNGYETAQNVTLNDTSTQAQPTNITSDGKLCDPNVQQHR